MMVLGMTMTVIHLVGEGVWDSRLPVRVPQDVLAKFNLLGARLAWYYEINNWDGSWYVWINGAEFDGEWMHHVDNLCPLEGYKTYDEALTDLVRFQERHK